MPAIIYQKTSYDVSDADCIGRGCLQLGKFYHRGATLSGSRNTSSPPTPCCMRRAYHGCPDDKAELYDPELARNRKRDDKMRVQG